MKIAIAAVITKKIEPHPLGGTEMFTYLLVEGLVKRGHDVSLYCAKGSKTSARQIEICEAEEAMGQESNVEFVYPYTLLEMRQILSDLEKENYEVLHINFLKTFMASFFANQIKIPLIHTIHRDFMESPRLHAVYEEIGFHPNEHFVFVSERARSRSLLKQNTHSIHNGIDTSNYPFSNEASDTFLWLSRIDELKGPKEAALAAQKAGVRLILSGDIDREKYQKYFDLEIKPLLSDTIVYEKPSSVEHKLELYQKAKALLFPIQWEEPFGLVVAEAMSCGTPVIAFNRGAMPEIVQDGVTGFLVDYEKGVDGLAEAIGKLNSLTNEEYAKMRKNSRKRIQENFSAERMVGKYEKLYQDLISQ